MSQSSYICYSIAGKMSGGEDLYLNDDIYGVITPINVPVYEDLLRRTHYDSIKTDKLIHGFTNGFSLEYKGPMWRREMSNNFPITVGSETEMWDKLLKEVSHGRYAGPFSQIPCFRFVQSPIGLVPKAGNKTRLIFHLSYDFGDSESQKSVNHFTPEEVCTVKYNDLDYAV